MYRNSVKKRCNLQLPTTTLSRSPSASRRNSDTESRRLLCSRRQKQDAVFMRMSVFA